MVGLEVDRKSGDDDYLNSSDFSVGHRYDLYVSPVDTPSGHPGHLLLSTLVAPILNPLDGFSEHRCDRNGFAEMVTVLATG